MQYSMIRNRAKNRKKPKPFFYAVPGCQNGGPDEQQNGDALDDPADDMRAGETLLFIRDNGQILLRRGGKEPLILDKPHRAVQNKKIGRHDHNRCKDGNAHFLLSLPFIPLHTREAVSTGSDYFVQQK